MYVSVDHTVDTLNRFVADGADRSQGTIIALISREPSVKLRSFAKEHSHQVSLCSDDPEEGTAHLSSALLYRPAAQPAQPSAMASIVPSMRAPFGFTCGSAQELEVAYAALQQRASSETDGRGAPVLLRPIHRQGAERDLVISSQQELFMYDFPFGEVGCGSTNVRRTRRLYKLSLPICLCCCFLSLFVLSLSFPLFPLSFCLSVSLSLCLCLCLSISSSLSVYHCLSD